MLLGNAPNTPPTDFTYRTLTLYGAVSHRLRLSATAVLQAGRPRQARPTTPHAQPLPSITRAWFSLIPFRSPLLRESLLFSPPAGTEMFHFPAFPPTALYIQAAATCHHARQVPPFGHPRINARLAAPRGLSRPPTSFIGAWCQGIHRVPHSLGHHRNKTLAHTIHKSKPTPHTQPTHTTRHAPARMARTTPTHPHPSQNTSARVQQGLRDAVVPSDTQQRAPTHHQRQAGKRLPLNPPGHPPTHAPHTMQHTTGGVHFRASRKQPPNTPRAWHKPGFKLLRKEVIQPHLPVRLPCYDFVPIASPTFTRSPPQRVRPRVSGVADFRDVTGGVYKARERIHRGVADPRLLATPPSWGRVADPNPN